MEILKYYDKAIDIASNFAVEIAAKHKGLSASGYLTVAIVIFMAIMVPREVSSLIAVAFLLILLSALRKVAGAERRRS